MKDLIEKEKGHVANSKSKTPIRKSPVRASACTHQEVMQRLSKCYHESKENKNENEIENCKVSGTGTITSIEIDEDIHTTDTNMDTSIDVDIDIDIDELLSTSLQKKLNLDEI